MLSVANDELLMVRTADTDVHVQEGLAAGPLDLLTEVAILLGAESKTGPGVNARSVPSR
jgi:hypothetical protein